MATALSVLRQPIQDCFNQSCLDQYLGTLLDELAEGVYFADTERRVLYWNKAAERISGYTREDIIGRSCSENMLVHVSATGQHLCENGCPLRAAADEGKRTEAEVYLRHKSGHRVPVSVRVFPVYSADGDILGSFEIFNESASSVEVQRRLKQVEDVAYLDHLTQIPNRRFLTAKLETYFGEFQRYGWPMGVLLYDLDYFKKINDRFGHSTGDRTLQAVAKTLSQASRTVDLIGRWGGEEFLGIYRNINPDSLLETAERHRVLVEGTAVRCDNCMVRITTSIGGTLMRAGEEINSLLERADQALYEAKEKGRNLSVIAF